MIGKGAAMLRFYSVRFSGDGSEKLLAPQHLPKGFGRGKLAFDVGSGGCKVMDIPPSTLREFRVATSETSSAEGVILARATRFVGITAKPVELDVSATPGAAIGERQMQSINECEQIVLCSGRQ